MPGEDAQLADRRADLVGLVDPDEEALLVSPSLYVDGLCWRAARNAFRVR
jgi:hypothetical protein